MGVVELTDIHGFVADVARIGGTLLYVVSNRGYKNEITKHFDAGYVSGYFVCALCMR